MLCLIYGFEDWLSTASVWKIGVATYLEKLAEYSLSLFNQLGESKSSAVRLGDFIAQFNHLPDSNCIRSFSAKFVSDP